MDISFRFGLQICAQMLNSTGSRDKHFFLVKRDHKKFDGTGAGAFRCFSGHLRLRPDLLHNVCQRILVDDR